MIRRAFEAFNSFVLQGSCSVEQTVGCEVLATMALHTHAVASGKLAAALAVALTAVIFI